MVRICFEGKNIKTHFQVISYSDLERVQRPILYNII